MDPRSVMARKLTIAFFAFSLAGSAWAAPQLDLPKKRRATPPASAKDAPKAAPGKAQEGEAQAGDVAGKNVGTTTKTDPLVRPDGKPVGTRTTTRVNTPNAAGNIGAQSKTRGGRKGAGSGLSLPDARRGAVDAGPADEAGASDGSEGAAEGGGFGAPVDEFDDPLALLPSERGSARVLYAELDKHRRINDPVVEEISDRLGRLGEDGLVVARYALRQDDPALAYAGARTLLASGSGGDADLVVRLLLGKVPPKASNAILRELVERDPVRATNELMCLLMNHDAGAVRRSANREMRGRVTAADVPFLTPILENRSTDARRGVIELLSRVEDPAAVDVLLDALTDRSASVAKVAIERVARSEDERVDFELKRRAFASGVIGRDEALILLTIIEREDRATEPLLTAQAVPALLSALDSPVPIVSNVAAIALAGVGFRSPNVDSSAWLSDLVPSTLVRVAAGAEYFEGFDLVRSPAIRRLRQLSGLTHGNDGSKWSEWWADNKLGFVASRAIIELQPGDEQRIVVRAHNPKFGAPLTLVGPALAMDASWSPPADGRVLYLLEADAHELIEMLDGEGIFGYERLPGPRGAMGLRGQLLEIDVAGKRKAFRFADGMAQPWFARVLARVFGLERRLAWQAYTVEGEHESGRELFLEQADWWATNTSEEARIDRVEELAFEHMRSVPVARRIDAIRDLVELNEEFGSAGAEDVGDLLSLLKEEPIFGESAGHLVDLTAAASGLHLDAKEHAALTEAQQLSVETLVSTLHDTFGSLSLAKIEEITRELGRQATMDAARDERGLMRVAAAGVLGNVESLVWPNRTALDIEEEAETLFSLSLDADEEVQVAAIYALGKRRPERADEMIISRAKSASVPVRAAALEVVGKLDSPEAIDILVLGLTDVDERFHLPAARGLAQLGTDETAPLLVSLLRSSSPPAIRSEARRGLENLGRAAQNELVAAMRSPDESLQREAALLLAGLAEPRVVPVLAKFLSINSDDARAAEELAVITCVDYRTDTLPSQRYFQFWDESEQREPFVWFSAALARRGLKGPDQEAYLYPGTEEARTFLLALLNDGDANEDVVIERARRELQRLVDEPLGAMPKRGLARRKWMDRAVLLSTGAEMVAPGGSSPLGR